MGDNELIVAIISILSIFVLMPATVIRGIMHIQRQKHSAATGTGSVGMRELESRMEEAVIRATTPIMNRLDSIEQHLRQLNSPGDKRIDEAAEHEFEDPELSSEKTVGRTRRQRLE